MTAETMRPVSDLVAQGWEILGFHPDISTSNVTFLLRRQGVHKVLMVCRKIRGGYYVVEDDEI